MATKKKAAPKKQTGKKPAGKKTAAAKEKQSSLKEELTKVMTATLVLVFVVAVIAMLADIFIEKQESGQKTAIESRHPAQTTVSKKKSESPLKPDPNLKEKERLTESIRRKTEHQTVYEIFDDSIDQNGLKRPPVEDVTRPRVAIIIDDIGFDKTMASDLSSLDRNLTLSILPESTFGPAIADELGANGSEVMLHLPMEPMEYPEVDPGPGALLRSMSPDQLIDQLRKNLDALPNVKGVNNHMGSRLTSSSDRMNQLFTVLKQRDMFFIDSRTSRDSQCRSSARLLQIPFAQRDVFLDNVQDPAYIRDQLEKLVRLAQRHGTAIGIGHPYSATYAALKEEIPVLKTKVILVPASHLVAPPG